MFLDVIRHSPEAHKQTAALMARPAGFTAEARNTACGVRAISTPRTGGPPLRRCARKSASARLTKAADKKSDVNRMAYTASSGDVMNRLGHPTRR